MALQLLYEAPTGDSYAEAYHRITKVHIDRADGVCFDISAYRDRTARTDGKDPVLIKTVWVAPEQQDAYFADAVLDSANPTKQAYEYLKTLAEYASATDV